MNVNLNQDLIDHINKDAKLLTCFIEKDYTEFLHSDLFRLVSDTVRDNHITYLAELARNGDREGVRNCISEQVFDYFPEFDVLFPSWWHGIR